MNAIEIGFSTFKLIYQPDSIFYVPRTVGRRADNRVDNIDEIVMYAAKKIGNEIVLNSCAVDAVDCDIALKSQNKCSYDDGLNDNDAIAMALNAII